MLDDAAVRRMVLATIPDIAPSRLEICLMDYDAVMGWWLRKDDGTKDHGRVIAIKRTEKELAVEIASDIAAKRCGTIIGEIVADIPVIAATITRTRYGTLEAAERAQIHAVATGPLGSDAWPGPYEGKGGRHPNNCTCSKHR